MEKSCLNCKHFHNCAVDGEDPHGYCSTNPECVGFCALWDGERTSVVACEGWEVNVK